MVLPISQETFDDAVNSNIEDFGMEPEVRVYTIHQVRNRKWLTFCLFDRKRSRMPLNNLRRKV